MLWAICVVGLVGACACVVCVSVRSVTCCVMWCGDCVVSCTRGVLDAWCFARCGVCAAWAGEVGAKQSVGGCLLGLTHLWGLLVFRVFSGRFRVS